MCVHNHFISLIYCTYGTDGKLQCKICKIPVKNEAAFIVHSQTKQHTINLNKLKQLHQQKQAQKMQSDHEESDQQVTAPKQPVITPSNTSTLPTNFFDAPQPSTNSQPTNQIAEKEIEKQAEEEKSKVEDTPSEEKKITIAEKRNIFAQLEEEEEKTFINDPQIPTTKELPAGFFDNA